MQNNINKARNLTQQEVAQSIEELEKFLKDKVQDIDSRIYAEKYTAPESYVNDMKGYSRGISHTLNWSIEFLRKKLLDVK